MRVFASIVERPRCVDAKRHSLYKAAGQLGSEAAKRNCHCEVKSLKGIIEIFENPLSQSHLIKRKFVSLLGLTKRNFLFSRPKGERLGFVSELERTYKFKRGVQRHKNTDRATECAMTNTGANLSKTLVGWAYQPNNEMFLLRCPNMDKCYTLSHSSKAH